MRLGGASWLVNTLMHQEGDVSLGRGHGSSAFGVLPDLTPCASSLDGSGFIFFMIKLYNHEYHAFLSFMSHSSELSNWGS